MRASPTVSPPLDACLYGVHAVARGAGVARIALLVGLPYLINVQYTGARARTHTRAYTHTHTHAHTHARAHTHTTSSESRSASQERFQPGRRHDSVKSVRGQHAEEVLRAPSLDIERAHTRAEHLAPRHAPHVIHVKSRVRRRHSRACASRRAECTRSRRSRTRSCEPTGRC